MRRTGRIATPTGTGLHLCDDALHLARVTLTVDGLPHVAAWQTIPLPPGAVLDGLVRSAGALPPAAARAIATFAGGEPLRVALSTADVTVVPLRARSADPLAAPAGRIGPGAAGDALWADVATIGERAVGLVAARRSSIQRTVAALRNAGAGRVAVEAAPVALVALAMLLGPPPASTWSVRLRAGRLGVHATASRAHRIEGGAVWWTDPAPALFDVTAANSIVPPNDLIPTMRALLGGRAGGAPDAAVVPLALAVGAGLGSLDRSVASPDLAAAVVVRPLGSPAEDLPRWAVEPMSAAGAPAVPGADSSATLGLRRRSSR